MLNNKAELLEQLQVLGLSVDEAKLYLELLNGPSTHSKLAHSTGINRTKVYRLADQLVSRSILTKRIDDRGLALVAADPAALEVELIAQEEVLGRKRTIFHSLLPRLENIQTAGADFIVNTYVGESGFKQMLWHELNAQEVLLSLGGCHLEKLVDSRRWIERYRGKVVSAGYTMRELVNQDTIYQNFTQNRLYLERYTCRSISPQLIMLSNIITIYNDTVATYCWDSDQKQVGVEVINASHAYAMRQVFESYWSLADKS